MKISAYVAENKPATHFVESGVRAPLSYNTPKLNNNFIKLEAPIHYIERKLTKAGFIKDKKPIPKLNLTPYDKEVIISIYNSLYHSIINYYSSVRNSRNLSLFVFRVLNSSCAKLLASKFSLSSQKKVFKKFGSDLINPQLKVTLRTKSIVLSTFSSAYPVSGFTGTSLADTNNSRHLVTKERNKFKGLYTVEIKRFSSNKVSGSSTMITAVSESNSRLDP